LLAPLFQSEAHGVGHSATAVESPSPLSFEAPLRLWFPLTVGVDHKSTAPFNVGPQPPPDAVGVGHKSTAPFNVRLPRA